MIIDTTETVLQRDMKIERNNYSELLEQFKETLYSQMDVSLVYVLYDWAVSHTHTKDCESLCKPMVEIIIQEHEEIMEQNSVILEDRGVLAAGESDPDVSDDTGFTQDEQGWIG